jgi:hypothetical protein
MAGRVGHVPWEKFGAFHLPTNCASKCFKELSPPRNCLRLAMPEGFDEHKTSLASPVGPEPNQNGSDQSTTTLTDDAYQSASESQANDQASLEDVPLDDLDQPEQTARQGLLVLSASDGVSTYETTTVYVTESDSLPSPARPPTPPAKMAVILSNPIQDEDFGSSPPPPIEKPIPHTNGHDQPHVHPHTLTPSTPPPAIHKRSLTTSQGRNVSVVLISSALETILASKEVKRSASFRESTERALQMVRSGQGGDRPKEIFEPLRLACETRNERLMIASLDCISKLISYSFFAEDTPPAESFPSPPASPSSGTSPPSLVDLVVHTITTCHTETTPEAVSLQIVKALLSLVLSPTILVHHSSLLKAVRTVYNVFLLSSDPVNQMVAQGGLTQMVHHVFTRCRADAPHASLADSSPSDQNSVVSSARSSLTINRRGSLPVTPPQPYITQPATLDSEPVKAEDSQPSTAGSSEVTRASGSLPDVSVADGLAPDSQADGTEERPTL